MISIRSFFLIICISTVPFSFSSESIKTNNCHDHAAQWSENLVCSLTSHELLLAVNMLYLLHANAIIDMKIRQFIIPITRLNQTIKANIFNYKNTTQELAALKTLLDRFSILVGARTIYNQKLETCLNYCNNDEHLLNKEILSDLQLFGQKLLSEYAQEKSADLAEKLKMSADVLQKQVEPLQSIAQLHQGLADGRFINYFIANNVTQDMFALASIDTLLKNNSIALQNAEQIVNTLDISTECALKIITIANDIYKEHYAALYARITSEQFDPSYATTIFGMNDILPAEYISPLPHPDRIFEHILETVKLYTHIEVVQ